MNEKCILIVDDDQVTIILIESMLKRNGFDLIEYAHNSQDAIEKVKNQDYDIILMDIHLGDGLDGVETAINIKQYKNIPIIFITAHTEQCVSERFLETGAYGFLRKPINEKDLTIKIQLVIKKHGEHQNANKTIDSTYKRLITVLADNVGSMDNLTNVYSHTGIYDKLALMDKETNFPLGVLFIDVNSLSGINQRQGNENGDKLLIRLAHWLGEISRNGAVARIGGDSFMLVLPNADESAMEKCICQLHDRHVQCKNNPFCWSYSLGYAVKESFETDIAETLQLAENRMNSCKLISEDSMRSGLVDVVLATFIEKTRETREHCIRLKEMALEFGERLHLRHHDRVKLTLLALLHDVGKIAIPDSILFKKAMLDKNDWEILRTHSEVGSKMVKMIDAFSYISEEVLCIHENWDGSGYPNQLRGSEIPPNSRIVAIIDTFDAMTSDRSYRKAMPIEDSLHELWMNAGKQFDPMITNEFIKMTQEKLEFAKGVDAV